MIIGVDAGTSVVKAAAFSHEGEVLALDGRPLELRSPGPDRREQDFEEILAAVGEVVRSVTRSVTRSTNRSVEMVGLTGQGDGLWLFDENGRSVRPAISWLDARGNSIVEEWMSSGVFEAVFRRNGAALFPGCPAAVMASVAREEPESLELATTAGYCKDGVMQRLTGERFTDASDASLPFLNVESREYDPEIFRLCELEDFSRLLAPVAPSPGPLAPLNSEGANLTGLHEGIPVHAGPFDLPACVMGAGVETLGDGLITLGTTLACQVLTDGVDTSGEPAGMTLCALEPDRWIRAMPAMVGTASMDLTLGLLGSEHREIEDFLEESPPGANGVSVLPFFSASGERAPFVEPAARGRLSGMDLSTTRADVVRAVCEGIGYAARHCLGAAGLSGEVSVCGGGAESKAWLQVLADILQRPVKLPTVPEVGAKGAALAALVASGRDFDRASWTRCGGSVEPREEFASLYEDGFFEYLREIQQARSYWSRSDQREPV